MASTQHPFLCPGCTITCCCGNQSRDVEEQRSLCIDSRFCPRADQPSADDQLDEYGWNGVSAQAHTCPKSHRTQVLPRREPTKLCNPRYRGPAKVGWCILLANHHRCHGFLRRVLSPAPESTTTEAVRVGGSADLPPLFRPAGRLLLARTDWGLLTSLAYSGVHSLRANDRVRKVNPIEAKASTYVGQPCLGQEL